MQSSIRMHWVAPVLCMAVACPPATTVETGIGREAAIALARAQVDFDPERTEAVEGQAEGRQIWRVTLQGRLPAQPPGLFHTVVVEIDQETGDILSLAMP